MGMKTFEMMKEAETSGKTYRTSAMRYSKTKGFHDSRGYKWEGEDFMFLNDLLDIDDWEELVQKKMTLKEIEAKLGYTIEIVNE